MASRSLSIIAAAALSAGLITTAFAAVEDIGRLPAPIANDYRDDEYQRRDDNYPYENVGPPQLKSGYQNPLSRDFVNEQIPPAIVDFRRIDWLINDVSLDAPDLFDPANLAARIAGGGYLRKISTMPRNGDFYLLSKLLLETAKPTRPRRECSSNSGNVVACQFYDQDLAFYLQYVEENSTDAADTEETFSSNTQTTSSVIPVRTPSTAQNLLIDNICQGDASSCYSSLLQAYSEYLSALAPAVEGPPMGASPADWSGDSTPVASPGSGLGGLPEPGSLPTPAPESPARVMVLVGLAGLVLLRRRIARFARGEPATS